jgi:hypothetical protein
MCKLYVSGACITLFEGISDDRSLEMSESDSECAARTMDDLMSERETCVEWVNHYWSELYEEN